MLSSELEICLNDAFQSAREARHEFMTVEHLLLAMNASALYLGMSLGSAAASQVWQHLGPWSPPAMSLVFLGLALAAFVLSRRAEAGTPATHPPARP